MSTKLGIFRAAFCYGLVGVSTFLINAVDIDANPSNVGILNKSHCYRSLLYEKPSWLKEGRQDADLAWTTSLAWVGERLYLADVAFNRIAEVSPGGSVETAIDRKQILEDIQGKTTFVSRHPRFIYPVDDERFYLLDYYDGLVVLNSNFQVEQGPIKTRERALDDTVTLLFVHRFVPWQDGVLTYSDLEMSVEGSETPVYKGAFVYLGFDDSYEIFDVEDGIEMNSLTRYLFLRDLSYLATTENGLAFALVLDKDPWIGKMQRDKPTVEALPGFPTDLRKIPDIDRTFFRRGADRALKAYQIIEESAMPIGLYAWRKELFVLAKGPRNRGETIWWLVRVDPDSGKEVDRFRIPTVASHVVLSPGEFFSVVEKGAVARGGKPSDEILIRKAHSIVSFPATWLSEPTDDHFATKVLIECEDRSMPGK